MAVLSYYKRYVRRRCVSIIFVSVGAILLAINCYVAFQTSNKAFTGQTVKRVNDPTNKEIQLEGPMNRSTTILLTIKDNHEEASRYEERYIKYVDMEQPGGDMPCDGEKNCVTSVFHSLEKAQQLCIEFGSRCKGFVYHKRSGHFYPKIDITGQIEVRKEYTFYLKKGHGAGIKNNLRITSKCAVPINVKQAVNTSDQCHLMKMEMKAEKNPRKLNCPGQRVTSYENGLLKILDNKVKVASISYRPIRRKPLNDWGFDFGEEVVLDASQSQFYLKDEFIQVKSRTADDQTHKEWHGQIIPKPDKLVVPKNSGGLPVNAVILGFDTLSHAQFKRAFPDAYKYMKNVLKSTFFNAYGIVGDGTTPALTAFLTGQSEIELPEARKGYQGSKPVDDWPWIFKEYKKKGYVTMYSEDATFFGTFTYRLLGFTHPPADHYGRYFWEAVGRGPCSFATPQHLLHLNYVKSYFKSYPTTRKFGFGYLGDLGHNNQDGFYHASEDLLSFLKSLYQTNVLNDTIVFILGDHGPRFFGTRTTFQGHLEERLPLMSITLPPWFETVYPDLARNLRQNTNSVTSPFDLHKTFQHILSYPELPIGSRSYKSFFEKIPESRTCAEARIAEHYCPCLQWNAADRSHSHIKNSANGVVEYINKLISSDDVSATLCERLQLDKILTSYQQMPNDRLQRFLGPFDMHGRNPKFAKELEINECNYQVTIRTKPGGAIFEASVKYLRGSFTVSEEISRLNRYGDQPKCILEKRNDLRKYCFCRNMQSTKNLDN